MLLRLHNQLELYRTYIFWATASIFFICIVTYWNLFLALRDGGSERVIISAWNDRRQTVLNISHK